MTLFLPLLALVAAVLWALQRRRQRHRLEKMAALIPGPPSLPLVGNVLHVGAKTEDFYNTLFNLYREYGSVFRLWFGPLLHVFLLNPDDLELLLTGSKHIAKGKFYDFLRPAIGDGLVTSSGEKWRKHRKLLTPTFHFKILEHFVEVIDRKSGILIDQLKKEDNGQSFDIHHYISLYALDTLQETAMGLDVKAQTDPESAYTKAARDALDVAWQRMLSPWLYPDVVFKITATITRKIKILHIIQNTTSNTIQTKKKEIATAGNEKTDGGKGARTSKTHMAFLELLLQQNATGGSNFTDQDILDEVTSFMFGHGSTAVALSFTLWLLSTHQDVQEKVYNEVKMLQSKTSESKFKVLNEMKYLDAVVKECLRLYPSIPIIARQLNKDFVTKGGITIPEGTTVVVPILLVHKNPQIYADAEAFIPERFLDNERNSRPNLAYIPFSAGPRNCIAQKFSLLSLKTSVANILMHYKLLPDVEFKPRLSAHLIMKSSNGIKMKISTREAAHS